MKKNNNTQIITVNNNQSNKRIDNFILSIFKKISKIVIYCLIRKGKITVNKHKIKPNYKIQTNDIITIKTLVFQNIKKEFNNIKPYNLPLLNKYILYEDKYLLILNKPAGMAVHGGSGINFGIIEILRKTRNELHFLGLAHRLDRDTSGNLIIAKNPSVLKKINQQFYLKQIKKKYIALVEGIWPSNIQIIHAPLLKSIFHNGERFVKVDNNGKYAESHFKIKEYFSNATLIQIKTITGRTHQIRVHTQYVNHPIIGDIRYGNHKLNKILQQKTSKRLFLHAISLAFFHPITNKKINITAPLDTEFKKYLSLLRQK